MKRSFLVIVFALLLTLPAALYAQDETPAQGVLGWLAEAGAARETAFAELLVSLPHSRTEDGAFVAGDPDAPLTIIEFVDWACPHCQEYRTIIEPVIQTYAVSGQVNFELRMFPTAGGEQTLTAGKAAECAEEQREGAFWEAYPILYALGESGDYEDAPAQLAAALDLDLDDLQTCMKDATQIETDTELGRELGVMGTPAVMIRQNGGEAEFISFEGEDYSRGAVPADVLESVIATLSDA
jgi:protein-disulfide isomerase